ncbi:MAG: FumA C-terminus/TtdB family hydratase beta subunit [Nitrososphaeria archaeon]
MSEYVLQTPVSEEDVRRLKLGDTVYVSGTIFTARDSGHRRALELTKAGKKLPVDFQGSVVFHCGPIAVETKGKWEIIAAGPTTSTRMESLEADFLEATGARIIVGKGGMRERTTAAMQKIGAVYCAFTGGAAVLATNAMKSVKAAEWLDLGMPEALWVLEVEKFGPLIVTIDAHGNNMFANLMKELETRRSDLYARIGVT